MRLYGCFIQMVREVGHLLGIATSILGTALKARQYDRVKRSWLLTWVL